MLFVVAAALHRACCLFLLPLQLRPLPELSLLPDLPLEGWRLHAGERLALQVEVAPRHGGILCSLVIFEFQGEQLGGSPASTAVMRTVAAYMFASTGVCVGYCCGPSLVLNTRLAWLVWNVTAVLPPLQTPSAWQHIY